MSHDRGPSNEEQEKWKKMSEEDKILLINELQDETSKTIGAVKSNLVAYSKQIDDRTKATKVWQIISYILMTISTIGIFLTEK